MTDHAWPPALSEVSVGGRPFFGETVSGDGLVVRSEADGALLAILDVLGHGAEAHGLARQMERWLEQAERKPVSELLREMHRSFEGTRGAAVCLVRVAADGMLTCANIGNALLRVLQPELVLLPGQPGTIGQAVPVIVERQLRLRAGALLLLTTDGVQEHLPVELLESWLKLPASRVSNLLMNDHAKWHDDATCVVARWDP
ncbi:SpoIIE family protein phosphatase [Chromobacterium sp. IIBBL 290-4]|uniref:SpoIIE family protein phosphatase n=1 Tax=Chromobacterium sp. IIBBL 290-4 TaxID=2953890 RepID=UPI0020B8773A|nr:SpoIIE family protein phosphatase [Chromobacterium sp. IIBBL 290-4]UTH75235.1 serine/threonine-protein phosphatase [Chromobacterium sp. IIBBL 290-4]